MLREAWSIMPLEKKISKAKHIGDLDRLCSSMAAADAYCAEVSLAFDKNLKECGLGRHSLMNIGDRLAYEVANRLASCPSLSWKDVSMSLTRDQRVIDRLAWYFI